MEGVGRFSMPSLPTQPEQSDDLEVTPSLSNSPPRKEGFGVHVDWFKDHTEFVGAPRPERHHPPDLFAQDDAAGTPNRRAEALKQVSLMADRYRAQLDAQKDVIVRKVRSSPNLQNMSEEEKNAERAVAHPPKPPCCSCASLGALQDILRRSLCCGGSSSSSTTTTNRDRVESTSVSTMGSPKQDPGARRFDAPSNAVIIFDWDDTLLPTTHILQTVLPNLAPKDRNGPIPKGTPWYEELCHHAHIVGFILRVARRAARVAIVTNSLSPWVIASGDRYLPGLNIKALLTELDIPVYYARRHVPELTKAVVYQEHRFNIELDHSLKDRIGLDIVPADKCLRIARVDETGLVAKWNAAHPAQQVQAGDWIIEVNGMTEKLAEECRKPQVLKIQLLRQVPDKDPYMEAKRMDMATCLKKFYSGPSSLRQNVISVGDSEAEQVAVKEALPRTGRKLDAVCKTVNLLLRPTILQLSNELKILLVWLSYIVKYDKDFDMAMNNLDSLEKKLFRQ